MGEVGVPGTAVGDVVGVKKSALGVGVVALVVAAVSVGLTELPAAVTVTLISTSPASLGGGAVTPDPLAVAVV